jgi:tetratricopeptide (TPR) repeat protein
MLGTVFLAKGDFSPAIASLRHAIAIAPSAGAYSNLGDALYRERRYPEAAAAFEDAVRMNPKSAMKHRNLGDAYARLGQHGKARQAYERAVALCLEQLKTNPTDARTLSMLAVYEAKLGRGEEALGHADRAVSLEGKVPDVLYRRAVVLALIGRPDAAVPALNEAVSHGSSRAVAGSDEDLAVLRSRPEFRQLVGDTNLVPETGGSK